MTMSQKFRRNNLIEKKYLTLNYYIHLSEILSYVKIY